MSLYKNFLFNILNVAIKLNIYSYPKKSLRVLMFHDIENEQIFLKQIKFLKKKWKFITPDHFQKICEGKKSIDGRYLLLTFDDGFKSNISVAENILLKYNIRAIFFIQLKFLLLNILKKNFFIKNNLKIKKIRKDMNSMNFKDLNKLIKLKHTLGAHSFSHTNLKNNKNKKLLNFEIIQSANLLEKKISKKINFFAFNFGRLNSISYDITQIAKKRFKLIFTGIRGRNFKNCKLIFRDNILPTDNNLNLNIYTSGIIDFFYKNERNTVISYFNKKV